MFMCVCAGAHTCAAMPNACASPINVNIGGIVTEQVRYPERKQPMFDMRASSPARPEPVTAVKTAEPAVFV